MKRIVITLLALLGIVAVARADTTSSRMGLTKPSIGSSNWGAKLNTNFDIIDSSTAIKDKFNAMTGSGTWSGTQVHQSSETFAAGSTITINGSMITTSSVTFNSASTATFNGSMDVTGMRLQSNIPMNAKKMTALAAGSTAGDSVRYEQNIVLQVVGSTTIATTNTTSSSFQPTTLTKAIVVGGTGSNRVRVDTTCDWSISSNANAFATIMAGTARNLGNGTSGMASLLPTAATTHRSPIAMSWIDAGPSGTGLSAGATTYTVHIRSGDGVSSVFYPSNNAPACQMILSELNGL